LCLLGPMIALSACPSAPALWGVQGWLVGGPVACAGRAHGGGPWRYRGHAGLGCLCCQHALSPLSLQPEEGQHHSLPLGGCWAGHPLQCCWAPGSQPRGNNRHLLLGPPVVHKHPVAQGGPPQGTECSESKSLLFTAGLAICSDQGGGTPSTHHEPRCN